MICNLCLITLPEAERNKVEAAIRHMPRHEFLVVARPVPMPAEGDRLAKKRWEKFTERFLLQAQMAQVPPPLTDRVEVHLRFVTVDKYPLTTLTTGLVHVMEGVCYESQEQIEMMNVSRVPIKDHERVEVRVLTH